MSEQKRRGNPAWQPGVSGNPSGRKKRGDALAEHVRALVDPKQLVASLLALAQHAGARPSDRLSAINQLLDRGWGKPIATTEIDATVNAADMVPAGYERMSPEERAAWLATLDIPAGKA